MGNLVHLVNLFSLVLLWTGMLTVLSIMEYIIFAIKYKLQITNCKLRRVNHKSRPVFTMYESQSATCIYDM